jgi:hypothetical protein
MNGARKAIDAPLWIDFSTVGAPPMAFILPAEHTPMGRVETYGPDVTIGHTTWFTEITMKLEGRPVVLYQMDLTPELTYLVACLDEYPEGWFNIVTGDDFGDGLTEVLKGHWPDIHEMLRLSTASVLGQRVLANLATATKTQWVVAEPVAPNATGMVDQEQVRELVNVAFEVLVRTGSAEFFKLPGVLEVMGGPDKLHRKMATLSNLIGGAGGIGGGLAGGVTANEVLLMGKDGWDFVRGLRGARRG